MEFELVPFPNQCSNIRILEVIDFVGNDFNVKLNIFRIGCCGNNGGSDCVIAIEVIEFIVFDPAQTEPDVISLIFDGENENSWRPTERSNPRPSERQYSDATDGTIIAFMAQNTDTMTDDETSRLEEELKIKMMRGIDLLETTLYMLHPYHAMNC